MVLAAGEQPKMSAPATVSIMFTDDDGESKIQVACNLASRQELENPGDGPGLSAVTDSADLNVVMGSTIAQGKRDFPGKIRKKLRNSIRHDRYDFLEDKGGYILPGKDVPYKVCSHSVLDDHP